MDPSCVSGHLRHVADGRGGRVVRVGRASGSSGPVDWSIAGSARVLGLFRHEVVGHIAGTWQGVFDQQAATGDGVVCRLDSRFAGDQQAVRPVRGRDPDGDGQSARESPDGLVPPGEDNGRLRRECGSGVPRRTNPVCPVPSSSVRAMEPIGLLRIGGRVFSGGSSRRFCRRGGADRRADLRQVRRHRASSSDGPPDCSTPTRRPRSPVDSV